MGSVATGSPAHTAVKPESGTRLNTLDYTITSAISCVAESHTNFVDDFLQFLQYSRGIFESCDPEVTADSALETDENILEFYIANKCNANLSKIRLHSMLTFGKGNKHSVTFLNNKY